MRDKKMDSNEFEKIQNEVKTLADKIINLCEKDNEIKQLYKGTQIFMSPIRKNPEIMFLGINPGGGHYKHTDNTPSYKFKPEIKIDYLENEYTLANEWKFVFNHERINSFDSLIYAFKTNCFYFATNDSKDLQKLIRISTKYIKNEIIEKSKEWTIKMIQLVSPKILICEGMSAFNFLKGFLGKELIMCEEETLNAGKNCKCARYGNIIVLGFSRKIDSSFKDIDIVIEKIDEYL